MWKERLIRHLRNILSKSKFSKDKGESLPFVIYKHSSLIRRKLGNVNIHLQENKAVNLSIAAPKVNGILIKPNETFSFWNLVGSCSKVKGYKEGLTISLGKTSSGIGGGICQFTNLLHWLALHSPLDIVEHHHHDDIDLFPDYGRQVPFGCGTSVLYNYLDYRLRNNTDNVFQFTIYTTDTHLCGELRALLPLNYSYHIVEEYPHFIKSGGHYYRKNTIRRRVIDKRTGNEVENRIIKESNARVMYHEEFIDKSLVRTV